MRKKALSAVLALSLSLSVFRFAAAAVSPEDESTAAVQSLPDDSLHFIVRHWHSDGDTDAKLQANETSAGGKRYFVVAEGYIVPDNSTYKFYLVYQGDTDDGHRAGEWKEIDTEFVSGSDYIEAIDPKNGTVTLKAKPLMKDGNTPLETFSAFSVSAGHSAVSSIGNSLTITYDPYVHLVKAHAFYVRETMEVNGTQDETVFGSAGAEADEQDTAWVYTYVKDFTDINGVFHKKGEIVKDTEGNPVKERNGLTDGENVELTKVYDTAEGLHTDKTAYVNSDANDGRTFDLELETWFAQGYPPQIGMILDASGSMAFASDNPSRIQLTEKQIRELEINTLPNATGESGEPAGGWERYFLSLKQLDRILDPRSTDNSPLSVSGYSYFVLNGSDYAPLGYWEGVNTSYRFEGSTDSSTVGIINSNNGFQTGGSGGSDTGLLLDAQPTSNAFTVSFMIRKGGSTPAKDSANIAELMYIGPLSGDAEVSSFYTLYREALNNGEARLRGNQQAGRGGNNITNINSIFNNATDYRVTLVFDGTKLTSYVNGVVGNSGSGAADLVSGAPGVNGGSEYTLHFENTGDIRIILGGVKDNYGGGKIWIDDVYVFDRALDRTAVGNIASEADKLIGRYMFDNGNDALKNSSGDMNMYATVIEQVALMSVNDNTSGSTVGPAIAETRDGRILGSVNLTGSNATIAPSLHHKQAGWYFVTHSGQYDNHYKLIGSGKRLVGLSGTQTKGVNVSDIVTDYTYTNMETDTPIRFYVDAKGNLLCFYSASNNEPICSYVYKLEDSQYVRTESLQRALGVFVTELNEFSPTARISAVRFSTDNIRDLAELVLLDWTDDPSESTGILSLERGSGSEKGTAFGSTLSSANKLEQYNYGLTGSTSTWRGLQAYIDNLLEYDEPFDEASEDVPKYLIIFTDGADSDHNNNSKSEEERSKALALADKLKNDNGYTIFTVLLDGGSMSDESYADAEKFLLSLAGKSAYDDTDDNAGKYFFSVHKAKEELGSAADGMNDADILMQIFVDRILEEIVNPLENYTVKDYIDPRFDLVDGDGVVWYLNANGTVVKDDGDEITVGSALSTQITLSDRSDEIARHPYLCYDSDAQMYYLQWVDQIIPGSAVGANRLAVWNARVTIRAKDDLIGGNNLLTNGNAAAQNLVFSSNDVTPSSGIDKANDKNNPSKGFPRVTVNVQPLGENQKNELTVYMGEEMSMETVLDKLIRRAGTEGWYYWEYLTRYARSTGTYTALHTEGDIQSAAKELAEAFIKGYEVDEDLENAVLKIPYFYLDESGGDMHRADGLGTMIYSVEVPTDKLLFSKTGWTVKTNDAINAVFRATYMPFDAHNRKAANDKLVIEKDESRKGVYLWNGDYKPAAGASAEKSDAAVVDKIEVVSGEIALQVIISDEAAMKLQSLGKTITYTADLYWGNVKVGTFIAEINADTITDKTVNAAIRYDNIDEFDRAAYGLPLGAYTVKNGHSSTVLPLGFSFGNIMLSKTESDYLPVLFNQGTGNGTPESYIATVSGTSFILGDRNGDNKDKLYTDYRFGLAQVALEYNEVQNQSTPMAPDAVPKTGNEDQIDLRAVFMILSLTGIVMRLSSRRKI